MKKSVVILITEDPRLSPRPAEALRVAAGLAVWDQLDITVRLRGPATQLVEANVHEMRDDEVIEQSLALLREKGIPVLSAPDGQSYPNVGISMVW